MKGKRQRKIEFGDFQTPFGLALDVCRQLHELGVRPNSIVEPTCGLGSFVLAAAQTFPSATQIFGFDINVSYLDRLRERLRDLPNTERIHLEAADFFATDWREKLRPLAGDLLVIGNFPWVNNATQGTIGGTNLPAKSNFLNFNGFDAISGKANFDISEWMLLEVLRWLQGRTGCVAMLLKTAVARKVLAHAERQRIPLARASIIEIDARACFDASVDACLLTMQISNGHENTSYDYTVFGQIGDSLGQRSGHRNGFIVRDIDKFETFSFLLGESPQKWRSGIKHDASSVMEFTMTPQGLENGLGGVIDLEPTHLYPLLKGSEIGSAKPWSGRHILVTQRFVGESTSPIRIFAPKTWAYLEKHGSVLDARASTIYAKNPRFSIFGVGDYAFRPWRIAICALYKRLRFQMIGPIDGRPVMFDDTVYYLSFDTEEEALEVLAKLSSQPATELLASLIFWDEKRPIKTGILNVLDWTKLDRLPAA